MRINLLVFTAMAASALLTPLLAQAAPAKQEIAQAPTTQPTAPPATPDKTPQPVTPPTSTKPVAPTTPTTAESQVLVGEVAIKTPEGQPPLPLELQQKIYDVISTKPGRTVTRTQIQSDINSIFATGFFSNVQAEPEDTDIGVRVTFFVLPNPVLKAVNTEGTQVLDPTVINRIFGSQIGKITN
ncbi:MAG: POTRA domain-containing protein, partial [Pseudanabaena sp. ELA748]